MKKILYLLLVKKVVLIFSILCMLGYQQVNAQALPVPVANFVVNRAVAGVITRAAIARGFAANDPRIAATLAGVGSSMTAVNVASTIAGVGLGIAGAPVWLTIAGGLAVLGVGAAIIAGNSRISIESVGSGNKLRVDQPAVEAEKYLAPVVVDQTQMWQRALAAGAPIYRNPTNCYTNESCYALPLMPTTAGFKYYADSYGAKTILFTPNINDYARWYTFLTKPIVTIRPGVIYTWDLVSVEQVYNSVGGSQVTIQIREGQSGGDPLYSTPYSRVNTYNAVGQVIGDIGPTWYDNLFIAASSMPASVKSSRLSQDTLAKLADKAWQSAAAQPGYTGLPYSYTQPVTAVDVAPWVNDNPASIPTIGDMLAPASNPGTNLVPISPTIYPTTSPGPNPTPNPNPVPGPSPTPTTGDVNVINTVKVDFGPDPLIPTPTLESTPTASAILKPLIDLFPSLRTFVVPSHASECPKPTFDVFTKSVVMDTHCQVLDSVKPTLSAVMAFVWVVAGLFIILGA